MLYFRSSGVAILFGCRLSTRYGRATGRAATHVERGELSCQGAWMRRTVAFLVCGLALVAVEARNIKADRSLEQNQAPTPPRTGPAVSPAQPAPAPVVDANAVVQKYCATCHSERVKSGGLVLQDL